MQAIEAELTRDGKTEIDFGDFLGIVSKNFKESEDNPAAELKEAFK